MYKYFKSNAFLTMDQSQHTKKICKNIIFLVSFPCIVVGIILNDIIFPITFILMLIGIFSLLICAMVLILEGHSNNKKRVATWNDNYYIAFNDYEMLISRPYCAGIENLADSMKCKNENGLLVGRAKIQYDEVMEIKLEERDFGNLEHGIWKARILHIKLHNSHGYHVYPTHFSHELMDTIEEIFTTKIKYHISKKYLNQFYGSDKVSPL